MRFLGLAVALLCAGPAMAADICSAIALHDVPAFEEPTSFIKAGETDGAITEYRISKKNGLPSVCSHGGYCYPLVMTDENGQKVEVLRLTNCKAGKLDADMTDDDFTYYDVDVIRSKVSAALLKYDDLDNRLLDMGLCSACAGNVADIYLKKPNSPCGKLTKRALEGNPEATRKLIDFPSYCSE